MMDFTLPVACLCLASGAVLGVLYLLLKLFRLMLGGGKLWEAVSDVIFCLLAAAVAFLCALVVDQGRLRLVQMILQGLGAWGVIVALEPFTSSLGRLLRRLGSRLSWVKRLRRRRATPKIAGKGRARHKKSRGKRKKHEKPLEKLM